MESCQTILAEMKCLEKKRLIRDELRYQGYKDHYDDDVTLARAYAIRSLFVNSKKHIYENDFIAGSSFGLYSNEYDRAESEQAREIVRLYEHGNFLTNYDHFAGNYEGFLKRGVGGSIENIEACILTYKDNARKQLFLQSAKITMQAFSELCLQYASAAREVGKAEIAYTCEKIAQKVPETFREALQLIWLLFQAFLLEGRYAMALGRMDQYLFPYYQKDLSEGNLTKEQAVELLSSVFVKIGEKLQFDGVDDTVNICIGGVGKDGSDATNELSYAILEAVHCANIPGPNLSARMHKSTTKAFYIACLDVLGTGLGYPAFMNDEININALVKAGYPLEHAREYCMVGCIENFLAGLQPPWSDGRFNAPNYLETLFNNGNSILTKRPIGIKTDLNVIKSMDDFLNELKKQLTFGASEYQMRFQLTNRLFNEAYMEQPFMSCFCDTCIERGLDINNGGTVYPSVHGVACMGIATLSDSLAAIEELVFQKKKYTLLQVADALKANFQDFDEMKKDMLHVPKYGNNNALPDQYAVWYIDTMYEIFEKYHTYDGGKLYIAAAANIQNISAGAITAATPDGRSAGKPLNDAASPTYGMDQNGPTAALLSCSKPDYTKAACGTVLNQKFSPAFFRDPKKKEKLYFLIRTYFDRGGQEIQINSVSKMTLADAMNHPEAYQNLIVRVSGFSAYFTTLDQSVQEDILSRTEHE